MSRSANATLTRCAPPRSASLSGGGGTPGGRGGAPRPARGRRGRAVARRRARRPARAPRPRPRRGRVACGAPAPAPARPTALNLVCNSPQVLFWGWLYTRAPSGGTLAPPAAWRAHRGRAGGVMRSAWGLWRRGASRRGGCFVLRRRNGSGGAPSPGRLLPTPAPAPPPPRRPTHRPPQPSAAQTRAPGAAPASEHGAALRSRGPPRIWLLAQGLLGGGAPRSAARGRRVPARNGAPSAPASGLSGRM